MAKRKITVTVDEELIAYIHAAGDQVSSVVNAALINEIDRRARLDALGELLDHWDSIAGPVSPEALAQAAAIFAAASASPAGAA
jgi:Post-segregation antitoxin CcdA